MDPNISETQNPELEVQKPGLVRKKELFSIFALLLIIGGASILYFFFPILGGRPEEPKNFSEIKAEDAVFAEALGRIRSGDAVGGQALLKENLAQITDPKIEGLYRLWIALVTNYEDPELYAKELIAIAVNESYAPATRTYAYSYLATFYLRGMPPSVLDLIVNDEHFVKFKVVAVDGSTNYGISFFQMLEDSIVNIEENPMVLAKAANILFSSIRRGEADVAEIQKAAAMARRALEIEADLQQEDTKPLYPEYSFLQAQTLGGIATFEGGVHAFLVEGLAIDEMHARALNLAVSSGDEASEASERINYALYIIRSYILSPDQQTKDSISQKVESIVEPFSSDAELRNTPAFKLVSSGKMRNDSLRYLAATQIAEYSATFASLMKESGGL